MNASFVFLRCPKSIKARLTCNTLLHVHVHVSSGAVKPGLGRTFSVKSNTVVVTLFLLLERAILKNLNGSCNSIK